MAMELKQYSEIQQVYRDAIRAAEEEALAGFMACQPRLMRQYKTPWDELLQHELLDDDERRMLIAWCHENLVWLDDEMGHSVVNTLQHIQHKRDEIDCHQCGVCCRVASSEYTYDQLLEHAKSGDVFAEQFTRVFLPYFNLESVRQQYPELVGAMLKEVVQSESIVADDRPLKKALHVFYCPYVGEDNRCGLYGDPKRPALCETYPENPLVFVQPGCAWIGWKRDFHEPTIKAHAQLAVAQTYTQRLHAILKALQPNP